jgi:tetratricopeptide (TPR) repeat protein
MIDKFSKVLIYLYMRFLLLIFILNIQNIFAQSIKVDSLNYGDNFEFIAPLRILDDQSAEFYYFEANNYYLKKQIEPAKALIDKANNMQAENANYWMLKAWIAIEDIDYNSALFAAQKAAILQPTNWKTTYCLAFCKQISKDYVGAVVEYSKVITLLSDNHLSYVGRANCKEALKDFEGAIADYSIAIMLKPTDEKPYLNRGILQYKLKNYYDAINDLSIAIVKLQDNQQAYYFRGAAYLELKDYANACTNFTKSKELGNKDINATINKYCIRK